MLISCVYAAGYCFRAFGRLANNDYMEFYRVLRASTKAGKFDTAKKSALSQYDCDFSAWPVEFSMLNLTG